MRNQFLLFSDDRSKLRLFRESRCPISCHPLFEFFHMDKEAVGSLLRKVRLIGTKRITLGDYGKVSFCRQASQNAYNFESNGRKIRSFVSTRGYLSSPQVVVVLSVVTVVRHRTLQFLSPQTCEIQLGFHFQQQLLCATMRSQTMSVFSWMTVTKWE